MGEKKILSNDCDNEDSSEEWTTEDVINFSKELAKALQNKDKIKHQFD